MSAVLSAIAIAMLVADEPAALDTRVSLRWDAPPECPSEQQMRQRAETLMLASDARVDASGEISAGSQGFVLTLTVASEQGRETNHSPRAPAR